MNTPATPPADDRPVSDFVRRVRSLFAQYQSDRRVSLKLISRFKELSRDDLDSAVERGIILKIMELKWDEYQNKLGISRRTAERLIQLVDHARMHRDDWEKPSLWSVCSELLSVTDKLFEIMIGKELLNGRNVGFVNRFTTRRQVRAFRQMYMRHYQFNCSGGSVAVEERSVSDMPFLGTIVKEDCRTLIPKLQDRSLSLVVTSPPYVRQREDDYESVPEDSHAPFIGGVSKSLLPKVTEQGSLVLVLGSAIIRDGLYSRYVHRTIDAVCEAGWRLCWIYTWHKSDRGHLGSEYRPRDTTESVLWFGKIDNPYANLTACGRESDRIGLVGSQQFDKDTVHGYSDGLKSGIANIESVIRCPIGYNDPGIDHPALFPTPLAGFLIETHSRPGDVVFDPFMGSGTVALAARYFGRGFIGCDTKQEYVDLANDRLKHDTKYFPDNPWLRDAMNRLFRT